MARTEFKIAVRREALKRAGTKCEAAFLVTCSACGCTFDRGYRISASRAARPQYCSSACQLGIARHDEADAIESLKARFEDRVIRRPDGQCWGWRGRLNDNGYGVLDHLRRPLIASRASYFIHHGVDPGELFVCHSCDNPPCTNPEHLWLGTAADNMRDASDKGRTRNNPNRGSAVNTSRLTGDQVRYVRTSALSHRELARQLGVTPPAIAAIRKGKNWRWLDA